MNQSRDFAALQPEDDATTLRRPRRHRLALWTIVVVVLSAAVAGGFALWAHLNGKAPLPPGCLVSVGASRYATDLEQAANATTITAVAKQMGMPDHAVTIALATALQESQLHNIAYGDRDSLGLFQQRPSQGWGTRAQVLDPRYAAGAFFKALARVPDWQTMSVTDAAQAVQHSNAPQAYALWSPMARALAIATTGEVPAGLTCQFSLGHTDVPSASPVSAITVALGPSTLNAPVASARGWTIACWLVGHADQYRITSVRYAGQQWTPKGKWTPAGAHVRNVQIVQSPPA